MHDATWKARWKKPEIRHGVPTEYNWVVLYPEKFMLGEFTDVGAFTMIMAKAGVVLDDDVEIGSHCAIYSESSIDGKKGSVLIGKGAKVGSHTTIMPDVVIGHEAVVGAHSLVPAGTTVPPYSVGWGVPYRLKRTRQPNEPVARPS